MSTKSFLDDMMTLGSGLLGNLADARHEMKAQARQRAAGLARELDLVDREDFDAAFAMLATMRDRQEELANRMAKIESHLGLAAGKTTVKAGRRVLPSLKTKSKRRR